MRKRLAIAADQDILFSIYRLPLFVHKRCIVWYGMHTGATDWG